MKNRELKLGDLVKFWLLIADWVYFSTLKVLKITYFPLHQLKVVKLCARNFT